MTYRKDKLHKGTITDWGKVKSDAGLGYAIVGMLDAETVRTSGVVAHDGAEIETRNSFYTLVGAEGVAAP